MKQNKQTSWNEVATWYDEAIGHQGSEYHQKVIFPALMRLIKKDKVPFSKKRILDIGCGQGVLCRHLAQLGAEVVGIDNSDQLLKMASERSQAITNCQYILADATQLLDDHRKLAIPLQPHSFDIITCVLAIQNMAALSPIWQAVQQLLKVNGKLLIVMMHPAFRIPQGSDWQWNEHKKRQERVVWSYLSSQEIEITAHPGKQAHGFDSATTWHFHRPLQAYINTLGNHQLLIDHIEELVSHKKEQPGVKSLALDTAREEFPLFLLLQARKVEDV